jgi:hypothetical protein
LKEFESRMEIFCDVCSSNWLVSYKREENSIKKKGKYQDELCVYKSEEILTRGYRSQEIQ